MNVKDAYSEFQLRKSRIVSSEIRNDFEVLPNSNDADVSISMGNNSISIEKSDDMLFSNLQLFLDYTMKSKQTNKSINIKMTIEGLFTYNSQDEKAFTQMLQLNGNTTLFSILRANVMTVSSLSLCAGKIVLPMINFLKLFETINNENTNNDK